MRLLAWNCRGIGKAPTVRALKALARDNSPDLVFLSETKSNVQKINKIRVSLNYVDSFCVESSGKAGGLALFWKQGVDFEVVYSDVHIIAGLVYSDPPGSSWLLLAIYGPPKRQHRKNFWSFLKDLIGSYSGPWLIIGDLNSIYSSEDKRGGSLRGSCSTNWFSDFVAETGALDLGFNGPHFTWSNKREGLANVKERLDRALCDQEWQCLFPKAGIRHLGAPTSDHRPILLDTHLDNGKIVRPFRFEAMWTKDEESSAIVEKAWNLEVEGSQCFKLAKKIKKTRYELKDWNKAYFGMAQTRIKELEHKIEEIRGLDPTKENLELEAALCLELNDWLEKEEIKWKQKSRELWLREGDRNSKFFHLSTLIRRRCNRINEIKLEDGTWLFGREAIGNYFTNHFKSIYQSVHPQFPQSLEGLIEALLGPDGFPGLFYRHYWSIVGVSRLRPLLGKLIDPAQTAFVPNRWITENVVLAQEIVHSFKHMKKKRGFLGMKLDFNKAYDRMEWSFLEAVLIAFGFSGKTVRLIMQCVSTVQFTLLLNGGICSNFCPFRGLRQGDPLSPYLFIMGSEVLMRLINREIQQGSLMGVKIGNTAPPISKLCYADDVILICRARADEVRSLMNCLDTYCAWSGQSISLEKSGVFYSKGVHVQFKKQICSLWGLKPLPQSTKYLGVPLFLSQNRMKDFHYLKERMEAKTCSWKSKALSWMGRATLIKSVALAIPCYTMAVIQLPKKLCEEMDAILRRFWWAPRKEVSHFFAPMAWRKLCTPKSEGGLGFRSFWSLNQTFLAKLAWWILSKKDSLCVKLLLSKYKIRGNWLNQTPNSKGSWTWRGIEKSKHILSKGACMAVGDGNNILVWSDPWVPDCSSFIPRPKDDNGLLNSLVVSQLFNQEHTDWDEGKLQSLFEPDDVQAIKRITVPHHARSDGWIWTKSNNGDFSIKSAYWNARCISDRGTLDSIKEGIWKANLHERLKMLLWRIASSLLPTKVNLARFIDNADLWCPLCKNDQESVVHIFLHCPIAKALWFGSQWGIRSEFLPISDASKLIEFILKPSSCIQVSVELEESFSLYGALIIDAIWKMRNHVVFERKNLQPEDMLRCINKTFLEFSKFRSAAYSGNKIKIPCGWCKPSQGQIKINCDAAIGQNYSVLAVVARDWRGNLVFALSKKVNTNVPVQAEAEALRWAVSLALARDLSNVVFESDSQICINAVVQSISKPLWRIQSLIWDIQSAVRLITNYVFHWVSREANIAAHSLASWSLKNAFVGSFDSFCGPSSFVDVISKEASSVLLL
uniref:Reverse transcriptase domain-containing protein n=2 Tax=Fagus sylvatica TaxID=28930 RepID=A0A2N9ET81_FAGSY